MLVFVTAAGGVFLLKVWEAMYGESIRPHGGMLASYLLALMRSGDWKTALDVRERCVVVAVLLLLRVVVVVVVTGCTVISVVMILASRTRYCR